MGIQEEINTVGTQNNNILKISKHNELSINYLPELSMELKRKKKEERKN